MPIDTAQAQNKSLTLCCTGAGALFIVKNYEGDVLSFEMTAEMTTGKTIMVATDDDVAVETSTYSTGRRGVAGTLIIEKMVGAAAERGMDLAALQTLGKRTNAQTRSMGVALTSCTVPEAGKPRFSIGDDEMEMGLELKELAVKPGANALLLVNGLGGTPSMEPYVMYYEARRILDAAGIKVVCSLVGPYVTALEMAGCSITVSLLDDELLGLWNAPVHTAALGWAV